MLNPSTQIRPAQNRLVKVENLGDQEYAEEFRGDVWVIPARGFIAKPVLEANRFIGQFKAPLKKNHFGGWERAEGPKPLKISELSEKERKTLEGVSQEEHEESEKQENRKVGLTCMKCGFAAASDKGLKIHAKLVHADETDVEDA